MITQSILSAGALRSLRSIHFSAVLAAALMLCILTGGGALAARADSDSPLAETFEAHGGLEEWSGIRAMTYTMEGFPLTPQVAEHSVSTVDLRTRNN